MATDPNADTSHADRTITIAENTTHTFRIPDFGLGKKGGGPFREIELITIPNRDVGSLMLMGAPVKAPDHISAAAIEAGDLTFTPVTRTATPIHLRFRIHKDDGPEGSAETRAPVSRTLAMIIRRTPPPKHRPLHRPPNRSTPMTVTARRTTPLRTAPLSPAPIPQKRPMPPIPRRRPSRIPSRIPSRFPLSTPRIGRARPSTPRPSWSMPMTTPPIRLFPDRVEPARIKRSQVKSVTSFEIRGTLSHDQAWVPDGAHGRS
ncbi:MAG: hypothetical protein BECKG1743D_GA0114223_113021 [Candidatus Kentron sp. G]|nr:MAG: hypothetical protein BECKG1743E_GA0114224_110871 [Candidatus Kentron sp. G]VFN08130.1 MAG: hypothetical protein BECKG1743D_GA0114223_113021 [Candidatus Kentron sp. G]